MNLLFCVAVLSRAATGTNDGMERGSEWTTFHHDLSRLCFVGSESIGLSMEDLPLLSVIVRLQL